MGTLEVIGHFQMCFGPRTLHSISFRWGLDLMGRTQITQVHFSASGVRTDVLAGTWHFMELYPFFTVAFKALRYLPLLISIPASPVLCVNTSPHFPFPVSHVHQGPSSLHFVFSVPFAW